MYQLYLATDSVRHQPRDVIMEVCKAWCKTVREYTDLDEAVQCGNNFIGRCCADPAWGCVGAVISIVDMERHRVVGVGVVDGDENQAMVLIYEHP